MYLLMKYKIEFGAYLLLLKLRYFLRYKYDNLSAVAALLGHCTHTWQYYNSISY